MLADTNPDLVFVTGSFDNSEEAVFFDRRDFWMIRSPEFIACVAVRDFRVRAWTSPRPY